VRIFKDSALRSQVAPSTANEYERELKFGGLEGERKSEEQVKMIGAQSVDIFHAL
jgi:hypothetical protein